jgi:hypothetical protein
MLILPIGHRIDRRPRAGEVEIDFSHPLARNLEAFYLLNEGGARVKDLGPHNRHEVSRSTSGIARLNHNGTAGRGQRIGGGVVHDFTTIDSTNQISCGTWNFDYRVAVTGLGAGLYCECWVWNDTTNANQNSFFGKNTGTGENQHEWMIGTNAANTVRFRAGNGASTVSSSVIASPTGRWIHFGGNLTEAHTAFARTHLYIDGSLNASHATDFNPGAPGAGTVALGNRNSTSGIDGKLALVAIWSRPFTDDEIAWRYQEPYDMLMPITRRAYFDVAAAAGAGGGAFPHHYYQMMRR